MVMQAGQLCCKKCCLIFGATTARKLVKIYFRNPEWVNSYYTQRPKIQPHTYTGLRNMQMWRDGAVRGCHVAAVRSLVPCSSELAPLLLPVHPSYFGPLCTALCMYCIQRLRLVQPAKIMIWCSFKGRRMMCLVRDWLQHLSSLNNCCSSSNSSSEILSNVPLMAED